MAAVLREADNGTTWHLEEFNLVGRSQDATIRLDDTGISRQHCTIRREGRLFWITDLGSANGSYVNDVALTSSRALRHGDRIQLGTLMLYFDQDESGSTQDLVGGKTQMLRTAVNLPVKTVQATLLVGDLKNFTSISAQLTAEEVAAMLREWYADCDAILKPRGAVIDKFIGDGVFAYWPACDADTRRRAAEAADLLSRAEASHSATRKWLSESKGIAVQCNVGLNVGPVALGAMGRGVNTAVGEAVNITFRIEGLTRKLERPVLASAAFVQGIPDAQVIFDHVGIHEVKGQPDPVEVYALRAG
ncbi:MAG: adenylate/guanylate cyclase domain-containing protein [Verrucomicrobiaceae bacterium]|nr:adenylate/guanylate cyclase domain-containing protein [Verrucomicrobiaceae bacterium]